MAWWNEIRDMLRQELAARPQPAPVQAPSPSRSEPQSPPQTASAAPQPLREARRLLQRTARELVQARARADALRRRLAQTQSRLEALMQASQPQPRYRERLAELVRAMARDSDLGGGFQAHLAQLERLHDQVNRQLRELEHDLSMADAAEALGRTTRVAAARAKKDAAAAAPRRARRESATAPAAGFRRARAQRLLDTLQRLPQRREDGDEPV